MCNLLPHDTSIICRLVFQEIPPIYFIRDSFVCVALVEQLGGDMCNLLPHDTSIICRLVFQEIPPIYFIRDRLFCVALVEQQADSWYVVRTACCHMAVGIICHYAFV